MGDDRESVLGQAMTSVRDRIDRPFWHDFEAADAV